MASGQRDRLAALIRPAVTAAGYDLEELEVTPAGRRRVVRVVVDADGGVSLDDVAEVSHAVSEVLDQHDDLLGSAPYVLEVTSPGVDRPLTEPRHWRRAAGRLVSVPVGGRPVEGRVLGADEAGVELEVAGDRRRHAYEELGRGRVQVELAAPGGPDRKPDGGEES
jgi:ribosome maturation factor RimP